jgi:TolB-like protein/Flp pilus assembly protein TadD
MSAILMKEPPDLSTTTGSIPAGLDRIVQHCLEKDPDHRYQTARDLAFNLDALSDAAPAAVAPSPGRPGARTLARAGALAAGLLVVAAVILLWRARAGRPGSSGPTGPDRKSIAVLPFQNLSPEPENAFFADGMTEDILTQLSKIQNLKVISRSSVMRYKGTQKPIQTIAAELGVGAVLEGSVRRAGDRVRIVGQLIDARTDEHLWAETYDRDLKDVFAIQSEVAQQIASALRATLSPAEKKRIEHRPTGNLAAYDQYLQGRELYYRYRKSDNESAIERFQKALELDPDFALAYAGLGDTYAQRVLRFGFPPSWLASSLEMSRKSLALDSDLAEGHKALGLAYLARARYRESLDANRRAIEINPSHAVAVYNYGAVLRFLGRFDEAVPRYKRAIELDPKNPILISGIGAVYGALGDAREAERWLKRGLELQPDLGQSHAYLVFVYLNQRRDEEARKQARDALTRLPQDPWALNAAGIAELAAADFSGAQKLLEQLLPLFGGTRGYRDSGAGVETRLAYLHIQAGRRAEAETLLDQSLATDRRLVEDGNQDWSPPYDTACVHALRGNRDEAFRWLDKAIEAGWRGWPLGSRDPLLNPLRSDPRFKQIEARIDALVGQMRRRAGLS